MPLWFPRRRPLLDSVATLPSRLRCERSPLSPPDVCNSTDLPEFEIISLLEEQLPVYRLRADTVYGYDHDDWLHTPLVAPDARFDLTAEQIEETLKYFCKFAGRFCVPALPHLSLLAFWTPVRVFAAPVLTHGCDVNGVQLRWGHSPYPEPQKWVPC